MTETNLFSQRRIKKYKLSENREFRDFNPFKVSDDLNKEAFEEAFKETPHLKVSSMDSLFDIQTLLPICMTDSKEKLFFRMLINRRVNKYAFCYEEQFYNFFQKDKELEQFRMENTLDFETSYNDTRKRKEYEEEIHERGEF